MGSRSCPGNWREQESCTIADCDLDSSSNSASGASEWSAWGDWGEWSAWAVTSLKCSKTCGGGQYLGVEISDPLWRACNTHKCPEWASWEDWSDCSKSCGRGTHFRQRSCENHRNETVDDCLGNKEQVQARFNYFLFCMVSLFDPVTHDRTIFQNSGRVVTVFQSLQRENYC